MRIFVFWNSIQCTLVFWWKVCQTKSSSQSWQQLILLICMSSVRQEEVISETSCCSGKLEWTCSNWMLISLRLSCLLEGVMERDRYMSPMEAQDFGLIDRVLVHPPQAGQDEPELVQKEPAAAASPSPQPESPSPEQASPGTHTPSSYKPEPWTHHGRAVWIRCLTVPENEAKPPWCVSLFLRGFFLLPHQQSVVSTCAGVMYSDQKGTRLHMKSV